MPSTSTFRVPPAALTGVLGRALGWYARRTFGEVPDNARVLWHHRRVLRAVLGFEQRVQRFDALDPHLRTYAVMAAAGSVGCSWCLDFGYFMAREDGLDLAKVREVPRWREASVFTPLERRAMEYAEAMSATPPTVTDAMVDRLRRDLGDEAVVELTMMVAIENQRSRFNAAMGLASQGYADVCELPLAVASTA
ncbi:carboxymuconolactone decarboxylase family protein [Nocardioides coralli]|uniref:carboxymuconolactone decarboxylase family protein n=1 Tax=Nocardioides coralli TaxID=2872154 RepID=UPI001CA3FF49|nr:carboxymuconolactone decarboxylase family protein [Nocardioides coralli]QZY29395.1 carboxymuconolactone decarboxylase family protein [Nocardioides coralli]